MATTTNFGWETPDDTDLVKDGALAMRTLGNSIDSSFVDLKGGTTGQVLAKASNTDLDYTWVTQDDANAIQNAIVDAKGDLIAASAADTPARLAVGNNGETLVADSSTSTGLRWSPATSQANPVINSAYQIWQRGTSISVSAGTNAYTADRWMMGAGGLNSAHTISRQLTNDTTNLPFIQYCARVQRNAGQTGTIAQSFSQSIETINSIPFVGKTVTLSFYARRGSNFSPTNSNLIAQVYTSTSTDGNVQTGPWSGLVLAADTTVSLTTTWTRYTVTGTIGSSANQLGIYFYWIPTGTAGANDFLEITGVQLDVGSVALPFRTNGATLAGELAACMRYYERFTSLTTNGRMGSGIASSSTNFNPTIYFTVPKRSSANVIDYANLTTYDSTVRALTSLAFSESNSNCVSLAVGVASGLTTGRTTELITSATGGFIGFSAEL